MKLRAFFPALVYSFTSFFSAGTSNPLISLFVMPHETTGTTEYRTNYYSLSFKKIIRKLIRLHESNKDCKSQKFLCLIFLFMTQNIKCHFLSSVLRFSQYDFKDQYLNCMHTCCLHLKIKIIPCFSESHEIFGFLKFLNDQHSKIKNTNQKIVIT